MTKSSEMAGRQATTSSCAEMETFQSISRYEYVGVRVYVRSGVLAS